MSRERATLLQLARGEISLMQATADLGLPDAGHTLRKMAEAGLKPYQLPDMIAQEQAVAGLDALRAAIKPGRGVKARITRGDHKQLTATLPWGTEITGTLEEVTDALHVCAVKSEDITMPDKNADDSPSTGQRIAIYAALKKVVWIGENQIIDRADFVIARDLVGLVRQEDLQRWVDDEKLFAIDHGGIPIYPRYGFTSGPTTAPRPVLAKIMAALNYRAWSLAEWFCCSCGMLDGRRPMDVLATDPEAVLAAAVDEAMGITHG